VQHFIERALELATTQIARHSSDLFVPPHSRLNQ